jgi:glycine hydroxymethyltransferase
MDALKETDPDVHDLIRDETKRQRDSIRLIASENYASEAVMEATGSIFTNKYSEGYPGKRYYQGQDVTDQLENLARDRATDLFGADHANVQPYSGSPANLAVYHALADLGDTILGMGLPYGGHLTHGWGVNFSGKMYDAHHYAVDEETERLDYEAIREKAREVDPTILICGTSAYPRQLDFERFADIAAEVGATLVADIAHISGLVAGGAHPSPVGHADVVTTTTHKTLRGPRGGLILCDEQYADAIDKAVFPTFQGGPHMHAVAAAAVAFKEASGPDFEDYADQIVANTRAMAEAFRERDYRLVAGGSDNHLVLIDVVASRDVGGKDASTALSEAGIVCNANSIPYDPRKPFDPSGIRIGTPSVTTRGMDEDDMAHIVNWIDRAIEHRDDEQVLAEICDEVGKFCAEYPIPGE